MKISVKINVCNEEDNIGAVCESVSWADEIVIVDSDSTDRTIEIAESFGARVLETEWTGDFGAARNVSFDAATSDWITWYPAPFASASGSTNDINRSF